MMPRMVNPHDLTLYSVELGQWGLHVKEIMFAKASFFSVVLRLESELFSLSVRKNH